jgi:hypothetical protein
MAENWGAIRANLATVLAAINGTAPYETTVGTVDTFFRTWNEVNNLSYPIIGISAAGADTEYKHTNTFRVVHKLYLWMHIKGGPITDPKNATGHDLRVDANLIAEMDRLIDDVIYALSLDQKRGGYATSTTITHWETDEADVEGRRGTISARMDIDIVYFRTTGKS